MTYSESEIGQTNRQLVEIQTITKAKNVSEILAELVLLVSSGPILLREQKSLEKLANEIKTSRAKTEALLSEIRTEYPKRSGI